MSRPPRDPKNPTAIDEGTADYFACSANEDPLLGEASLAEASSVYLVDIDPDLPARLVGDPSRLRQILGVAEGAKEICGSDQARHHGGIADNP